MSEQVSICIPVYNGARFIAETLESLLRQSHRDLEIIVSDNASGDDTVAIVSKYGSRDQRLRLLTGLENIGYSRNIRKAVLAAKTDIVCVYHSDDVYEPTIVEKQLAALRWHPHAAAVFVKPDTFTVSVEEAFESTLYGLLERTGLYHQDGNVFYGGLQDFAPILLEYGNVFACPSLMTFKDAFLNLGGFRDDYPSNEDLHLWIDYLKDGQKLCIINEGLMHYRRSVVQGSHFWEGRLECPVEFRVLEEQLLTFLPQVSERTMVKYNQRKARALIDKAFAARARRDDRRAKELMRESRTSFRFAFPASGFLLQSNISIGYFVAKRIFPILRALKYGSAIRVAKRILVR
jgi:glycosyltransferase involved in cell wall biosynthesis